MKICFSKHCHNNILFDVLPKYSSQYSKSIIFSVEHSVHISATFHLIVVVVITLKKEFRHFFSYDFTIVTGDGNANDIVLFIVSRLPTQIQLSITGLLIVMGKPLRNAYLSIVKRDWTSIVC